jgi:hypothetical protein
MTAIGTFKPFRFNVRLSIYAVEASIRFARLNDCSREWMQINSKSQQIEGSVVISDE